MQHYPLQTIYFTWETRRNGDLEHLIPDRPYLITPTEIRRIRGFEHEKGKQYIQQIDGQTIRWPRWSGPGGGYRSDLNGLHVGYLAPSYLGDCLCHTAAIAELKREYPAAKIHVWAQGECGSIFEANRDVASVRPYGWVLPAEEVTAMDCCIIPRPLPFLRRSSSANYYELLGESIGLRITFPRPYVYIRATDRKPIRAVMDATTKGMPHILVQMTASDANRTPGDQNAGYWHERLKLLSRTFQRHWIIAVGDDVPGLRESLEKDRIDRLTLAIRHEDSYELSVTMLLEVARTASLVISPDSFGVHAAAAFETPCLALWQTEGKPEDRIPAPATRIGTYKQAASISMHSPAAGLVRAAGKLIRY
jgi:hypothetical protein